MIKTGKRHKGKRYSVFVLVLFVSVVYMVTGSTMAYAGCCLPCSVVVESPSLSFILNQAQTQIEYILPRIQQIKEEYSRIKNHKLAPGSFAKWLDMVPFDEILSQTNLQMLSPAGLSSNGNGSGNGSGIQNVGVIEDIDSLFCKEVAEYSYKDASQFARCLETGRTGRKTVLKQQKELADKDLKRKTYYDLIGKEVGYTMMVKAGHMVEGARQTEMAFEEYSVMDIDVGSSSQSYKDGAMILNMMNRIQTERLKAMSLYYLHKSMR